MNHEHTSKLHRLRTLHLFAGAGGGILADLILGHQPVCAVEIEPYCQQVLHARQKDGFLPWFPIFDDVKTFDGKPWRGRVDVVCGGFPCQDISSAGKGAGISGERSGLWGEMARLVREIQPRYVFVENSPMLTIRGIGVVLADLAAMGYNARWGVLGASDIGAPHIRKRIWILAYARGIIKHCPIQPKDGSELGRRKKVRGENWEFFTLVPGVPAGFGKWREMGKPGLVRDDDGLADTLDRLHAIGNGQVPAVAALAWRTLSEGII